MRSGSFTVMFDRAYDFTEVTYPHGDAVVYGQFSGNVASSEGYLVVKGTVQYYFWDVFTDPTDIRELFLGTSDPAAVDGLMRRITRFEAEAFLDANLSRYK